MGRLPRRGPERAHMPHTARSILPMCGPFAIMHSWWTLNPAAMKAGGTLRFQVAGPGEEIRPRLTISSARVTAIGPIETLVGSARQETARQFRRKPPERPLSSGTIFGGH
jgi:hypothetical protein